MTNCIEHSLDTDCASKPTACQCARHPLIINWFGGKASTTVSRSMQTLSRFSEKPKFNHSIQMPVEPHSKIFGIWPCVQDFYSVNGSVVALINNWEYRKKPQGIGLAQDHHPPKRMGARRTARGGYTLVYGVFSESFHWLSIRLHTDRFDCKFRPEPTNTFCVKRAGKETKRPHNINLAGSP